MHQKNVWFNYTYELKDSDTGSNCRRNMHRQIIIGLALALFFFLPPTDLQAQGKVFGYLDLGMNEVSDGFYLKSAGLVKYELGNYKLGAGVQLDLVNRNGSSFSGLNVNGSRKVPVKDFPAEIRGFFLWNSYIGLMNETNWGFIANVRWPHVALSLGNEFRSFHFKKSVVEDYGYEEGEHLRENWNLVYNIGYHLRSPESTWDLGASLTNLDHFLVNQETNPFFKLNGRYSLGSSLGLLTEVWYKSSGSFNLSVNYFGFFIRTGVTWKF